VRSWKAQIFSIPQTELEETRRRKMMKKKKGAKQRQDSAPRDVLAE
jgi:hypothetical protein